jgi:isoleucyl-tRNA synthetase
MFEEITNETFSQREERILHFWLNEHIFAKSVELRKQGKHFSFYDGPPFATGLPHYGHLLAGTIKDVVPRYKTMKGFCVPRRFGWDCHGLPVEQEIEKAFNLSGAHAIEEFGVDQFNEECRKIVLRYTAEWKSVVERMGRWVDFDNTYRTMDLTFMESVWWAFKKLFDLGLVYEGHKVMPFSAKLGTPLSNFEASENYKDVDDPSITVAFELNSNPLESLLAWTTTPWTLVSNLAVMAGPEIVYVKIKDTKSGHFYWLAEARLGAYFKDAQEYEIVDRLLGQQLADVTYKPLFDYFADRQQQGAFKVILDPGVSVEEGTGFVHCAPAFGEADFYAAKRAGIELVCPVDGNGLYTADIAEYTGLFVKDADKDIIKRLKASGKLYHQTTLRHRYPFCWRSDTPLIYKAVTTWFVAVEKIKDKMIKANQSIHWTPGHIKEGRFGKWLEGARDWAISRNRYWGTPLPLWRSEDGELLCLGSIQELMDLTGEKIKDLHRHFIDHLTIERNGKVFKRIPEVFDCWFESGSMPYAQNHYPFENQRLFEENFPADFIAEGADQTRGWFYTLTVLSAALFNKPAFKNVIVNGIVLSSDGAKMSKRLRNYPDPMEVVHKHGADAIRLYMMHSPAVKADDLCFKESGVELVLRQVLIPFWNAYSFFLTYANIYQFKPEGAFKKPHALIDRWIVSQLNKLIHDVETGMDGYDLSLAVEPFVGFIDQLTNWYIRRSRRRFWSDQDTADRQEAFATLYYVLMNLAKIAAPFVPFIAEAIYRNVRHDGDPISVHLCHYPTYRAEWRDLDLEEGMAWLQKVVSLGHALRKDYKLKVRQPLALAEIACASSGHLQFLESQKHLIEEELNVKKVLFHCDESPFVKLKVKPNFRILGKKIGGAMKAFQERIAQFTEKELQLLLAGKSIEVEVLGQPYTLGPEDVEIERTAQEGLVAATSHEMTIALNTTLNEDLIVEGLAREIVNKVNTMRRENQYAVSDRISLKIDSTPQVKQACDKHREWIAHEVLAKEFSFGPCRGTTWDLNGQQAIVEISQSPK